MVPWKLGTHSELLQDVVRDFQSEVNMASREVGGPLTINGEFDPQTSKPDTRVTGAPTPATQVAWGLKDLVGSPNLRGLALPGPAVDLIKTITNQEQGPLAGQAAALDVLLTARGRPRGNTDALPLGKDDKGNEYGLTRTNSGVQISVKAANGGGDYTLEVSGGGKVKSATYVAQDGTRAEVTPQTINKMVSTAVTLAQQPTPAGTGKPAAAPEL